MRLKNIIVATLPLALVGSGCLRLMDAPPADGAKGAVCREDADCSEGSYCKGTEDNGQGNGTCSEPGTCETHYDCADGERCLADHCEAVECTGDYDEADTVCGGYECDTETYTCLTHCDADADCSGKNVCRAGACLSPKCTASNEAVLCEGYTCDVILGECRDQLESCGSVGCAQGYVCIENRVCRKKCTLGASSSECGNYECGTDSSLSGTAGVCAISCTAHTDCLNGTACVGARCSAPPP